MNQFTSRYSAAIYCTYRYRQEKFAELGIQIELFINTSPHHRMQESDAGIDTIFNVPIHRVLKYREPQKLHERKALRFSQIFNESQKFACECIEQLQHF